MNASRVRRLLVVLDDAGPGDALRSMAALGAIRAAYATSHITLVVSDAAAGVFETARPCDRIVVSHIYRAGLRGGRDRFYKIVEVVRLLRSVGVNHDLALILNWGTTMLDAFGRLTSRRVIGFRNRAPLLLSTSLGPYDVDGDPVEQNWRLLLEAGVERRPSWTAATTNAALPQAADDWPEKPYAVLHAGSDWACQQWSADSWAELADRLGAEYGVTVVWTGLAEEASYIRDIQARMRSASISLAGKTSVSRLQQLIGSARLCICVDSAPFEIAQLTSTPLVVIAGPTPAQAHLAGLGSRLVVNRTPAKVAYRIRDCQRSHVGGHCHDYGCPLSQLPYIRVDDVLSAVAKLELTIPLGAHA